jgi:molybdopterin converting factor small subunit
MSTIRIPPVLRTEAGGARQIEANGSTVREVLRDLVAQHPALEGRVLPDGEVPSYLNLFVDGQDVRTLAGLDTEVSPQSVVLVLPAVAGGTSLM